MGLAAGESMLHADWTKEGRLGQPKEVLEDAGMGNDISLTH